MQTEWMQKSSFIQAEPGYQILRGTRRQAERVVKYKQLISYQESEFRSYRQGTRQNQNRETKGCLIQYLTKLAY